jgi:hypothetical protein
MSQSDVKIYKHCDHTPVIVFFGKDWEVHAGTKSDCKPFVYSYDLIVDCTGFSSSKGFKHTIPIPGGEEYESPNPPEILLDWDNYKSPCIKPGFWKFLLDYIKTNNLKVLVYCQGGHGRTGTAVGALMVASGMTANKAFNEIRQEYCDKAIESQVQLDYLYELEKYYKGEK